MQETGRTFKIVPITEEGLAVSLTEYDKIVPFMKESFVDFLKFREQKLAEGFDACPTKLWVEYIKVKIPIPEQRLPVGRGFRNTFGSKFARLANLILHAVAPEDLHFVLTRKNASEPYQRFVWRGING